MPYLSSHLAYPENWPVYRRKLRAAMRKNGSSPEHIDSCLKYASKLYRNGMPIIFDSDHLAVILGLEKNFLLAASYAPQKFYRHFSIPKKNGKQRAISEPLPLLKYTQHWLLENTIAKLKPSRFAKAYAPGASTLKAARFHKKQDVVIRVDLKNFFPSISTKYVVGVFRECGYANQISSIMARLCTLKNGLPQGAPTSPCLSNLVSRRLDTRISSYCMKKNIRYTRYADDLIFSGESGIQFSLLSFVHMVVSECGFAVNNDKTRVYERNQQQRVLGLVVNDKLSVPRNIRRKLRQDAYFIEKYGIVNHANFIGSTRMSYSSHLQGMAHYILHINPTDRDALQLLSVLNRS